MSLNVVHEGFAPDAVPYLDGWERQRQVHAAVVAGELPDTLLLLEHEAVYTAGKRTEPHERPVDGTPVVDVDRGGKITWHGPGQLVGYPIVRLPDPVDVVAHVRRLETALMAVCADLGPEHDAGRGAQRGVGAGRPARPGPQARRDRHPGLPGGDHARVRAELRLRPVLGPHDRAVRDLGRRRSPR